MSRTRTGCCSKTSRPRCRFSRRPVGVPTRPASPFWRVYMPSHGLTAQPVGRAPAELDRRDDLRRANPLPARGCRYALAATAAVAAGKPAHLRAVVLDFGRSQPAQLGFRADGSPVLFDWELFGPGTPAIDLAIVIPGLGNAGQYAAVAESYVALWSQPSDRLPWTVEQLARDIALAKVASVVRLLAAHADGAARVGEALVTWLVDQAPAWLANWHTVDARGLIVAVPCLRA